MIGVYLMSDGTIPFDFNLLGYTTGTGDTPEQALKANLTTSAPSFTNIVSNQYVIVWNENCQAAHDDDECDHDDNGHHYGNDKGDNHDSPKDSDHDKKGKDGSKR